MNLSVNARDAMDGSGQLTIKLGWAKNLNTVSPVSHKPIRGDWIELSVSDTGSGIDTDNIAKIFNPFFTTKEVGKGTGMGLSVVYKIIEDHQGHILIDSEPGKGTNFRLLFNPLIEGEIGVFSNEFEDQDSMPMGDGSSILVVDDEQSIGDFLSSTLDMYGYQPTYISDSEQALNEFRLNKDQFALVITDQTMPKMTGIELITKIRDIKAEIPLILCTGYSDRVDAGMAKEMEIAFFEKPVDIPKLLDTIAELLANR